jgi:transcriptional regulator with XRE-family HTH domain
MDDPLKADTPGKRLKWLREKAGYKTGSAAAQAFGWKTSTYLGHENGDRQPSVAAAKRYAAAFKGTWAWIMDGAANPSADLRASPPPPDSRKVFISYSREHSRELVDLLMSGIYDPSEMPEGSAEEKAVFTLLRHLRKKGA